MFSRRVLRILAALTSVSVALPGAVVCLPSVALARRQGANPQVAPGATLTLNSPLESQGGYSTSNPPSHIEVSNSSGAVVAFGNTGSATLQGWSAYLQNGGSSATDQMNISVPASATPGQGYRVRVRQPGIILFPSGQQYYTIYLSPPFDVIAPGPVLTATTNEADRVQLSWTDLSNETAYRVERKNAGNGWDVVATLAANALTYTDTGLTENTAYQYRVVAIVGGADMLSNEAVATTPYAGPNSLSAIATGSGKITLYFSAKEGATGYNIFRATVSGGQNYSAPANGNTPVTTLSFPNSDMLMFTDNNNGAGLTNGVEYFYVVKAVYPNNVQSVPSGEDVALVDPDAIPWDTRDANLIANATVALAGRPMSGPLRIMGPDGCVYEATVGNSLVGNDTGARSGQVTPIPVSPVTQTIWVPDATPSSDGGNLWVNRDDLTFATPDPLATGTPGIPITSGPVRRLVSQERYVRTTGEVLLPEETPMPFNYGVSRVRAKYGADSFLAVDGNGKRIYTIEDWTTDDTPFIYFGSGNADGGVEVDAGLIYQKVPSGEKFWRPIILFANRNRKNVILTPTISPMIQNSLFNAGERVSMNYWVRGATRTERETVGPLKPGSNAAVVYLEVGYGYNSTFSQAAIVKGHKFAKNEIRMKRCNSIAQSFVASTSLNAGGTPTPAVKQQSDFDRGFRKTGTYVRYADWFEVKLHDTVNDTAPSVRWLANTTVTKESLRFPDDGSITSNLIFGAYYNESQLSIDLRPF